MSEGVITPTVCSHIKKRTKNTQAVAETNSNEFGRQGESSDSSNQVQRQPQTKGRKSVAGSCAHQSDLRRNLGLTRVASYSDLDPCVRNFWIISSVGNLSRSSSPLHAADNPSRSSGSLLRCITSESARNTSSVKLSPVFSSVSVTVFGNCLASSPTASYTRQVSHTINRSPSALVPCAARCCCRACELVSIFFQPS